MSPFMRHVSLLSGGSAVSMVVPILAAPILGRLYAPAEYGALAQYMAFAAILSVVATLQFQHAIISEKTLRAAKQVVWLCITSSSVVGLLAGIGVALAWPLGLGGTAAGAWLWFLPVSVALSGIVAGGSFLANRLSHYRRLAGLPVLHTALTVGLSIALGISGWGSAGLMTAYFAGQVVQALAYGLSLKRSAIGAERPALRQLALRARRHWKFPALTLPSEFAGQINMQTPIFALTAIGADATLGSFARARQLVSMPMTALGGAVAQVFRRDAAEHYRTTGTCRPLMLKTAGGLFAAGLLPCLLILWQGPFLFEAYLGPDWREAGELARILAPMLLLRLMVSPITTILYFSDNQALDLCLTILSAAIIVIAVGMAWLLGETASSIILAYSIGYIAIYILYLITCYVVGEK